MNILRNLFLKGGKKLDFRCCFTNDYMGRIWIHFNINRGHIMENKNYSLFNFQQVPQNCESLDIETWVCCKHIVFKLCTRRSDSHPFTKKLADALRS